MSYLMLSAVTTCAVVTSVLAQRLRDSHVLSADQNFTSSSARSTTEVGVMVLSLSVPLASA